MSDQDWKQHHANQAEQAVEHPLVQDVITELLENLGLASARLPRYGIEKVAYYAAQVARAQALGIDPALLTMSREEADNELWCRAAMATLNGVPTIVGIEVQRDKS